MVGELIGTILVGIVAGYLGRLLLPGKDSMGFVATVAVGVAGALLGWAIFTYALGIGDDEKIDFGGILGAIIGTMILLGLLRMFRRDDTTAAGTAPRA
jgi:uncharacterized membrane protein YeaQ/YmgE (transglycosylase-associated protein family)